MTPSILLLCLLAHPTPAEDPPPPMERAGPYSGLIASSEFEADGRTWDLEVGYGFPARARHRVSPRGGRSTSRRLTFRYGAALWSVAPGQARSQSVPPGDHAPILRRLELRRALFLWPHDFPWAGSGDERLAELGEFADEAVMVRALLDPATGLPHALEALGDQGQLLESITDVGWGEPDTAGHAWPIRLTLRDGQKVLWREEVLSVTPAKLFDRYFQPADRRRGTGTPKRQLRSFDLPPAVGRSIPLEGGLTVEVALTRAEALIDAAAAEDPDPESILPEPILLLDGGGRPTAIWIQRRSGPAPEGWEERPGSEALGLFLASPTELRAGSSTDLFKAALRGGRAPGTLFLRVRAAGAGPRRAELVLTLDPR